MIHTRRRFILGSAALALSATATRARGAAAAETSVAQAYPGQSLRWIIYQSPGGLIDGSSRAVQPYLKAQGFASEIEYVRGASGRIARTQLYRSQPDGYTIMTEAMPEEVLGEVAYGAEYKVAEFQPVFGWYINAFNIYVQASSPIKSFGDFISEAKKRKITIGTLGKGGPSHLQLAILRSKLGLNLQFVHFEGGAPAGAALRGGHVESAVGGPTNTRQPDGLRFLAVFRKGRDPALPEMPTVAELGYDITPVNEVIYANTGPKVPADRLAKLADAFTAAFKNPDHVKQQQNLGVFPTVITGAELRQMIQGSYSLVQEYKAELTG
jgi:tripartite-type tricarboxylate transporter receptor subunit TctC